MSGAVEAQKRLAAEAAVEEVRGGMIVGLGTGSTAAFAIAALGRRVAEGLSITAVATSRATAQAAAAAGIALRDLGDIDTVDLCIDGVDEIDPAFAAIKGAGGAMLREKIVATAARRMIAVADATKAVDRLGARDVPVELVSVARSFAIRQIVALGGRPTLRLGPDGAPWRTDQDNIVLDCAFGTSADFAALAPALGTIPGVAGHGLFLSEIDALYLGTTEGLVTRERRSAWSLP